MPAKPAWLLAIPEILHTLQSLDTPVVDRATASEAEDVCTEILFRSWLQVCDRPHWEHVADKKRERRN